MSQSQFANTSCGRCAGFLAQLAIHNASLSACALVTVHEKFHKQVALTGYSKHPEVNTPRTSHRIKTNMAAINVRGRRERKFMVTPARHAVINASGGSKSSGSNDAFSVTM